MTNLSFSFTEQIRTLRRGVLQELIDAFKRRFVQASVDRTQGVAELRRIKLLVASYRDEHERNLWKVIHLTHGWAPGGRTYEERDGGEDPSREDDLFVVSNLVDRMLEEVAASALLEDDLEAHAAVLAGGQIYPADFAHVILDLGFAKVGDIEVRERASRLREGFFDVGRPPVRKITHERKVALNESYGVFCKRVERNAEGVSPAMQAAADSITNELGERQGELATKELTLRGLVELLGVVEAVLGELDPTDATGSTTIKRSV